LEKKLRLTDVEEENSSLKRQLESIGDDFGYMEREKRELDELVIRVSQQLKRKDAEMHDLNLRMA